MGFLNFLFGWLKDREWERIKKEKRWLDEEWDRLYEERRKLRNKALELSDLEERLLEKENDLRRLERNLARKDQDISKREEEINKKAEEIKDKIKVIKQKLKELKRKENELNKREKELEEMLEVGMVRMVPVRIKIRAQDQYQWYTEINFDVPIQYAGMIRAEIQKHLSGTEYKLTNDGFYWKFRVRAYADKKGPSSPQWFHVLRWLEDNRVILNRDQYTVVTTTSGIAGWIPKEENLGDNFRITHICEGLPTSGFAEVTVMVGESAQEEEEEIPF